MKVLHKTLLLSLAVAAASPALAYEAGDVIVRAGVIQVTPETTNNTLLPGLDVDDDTQLGLTVNYMLTPHVGVELLGATPFEHDITLGGVAIGSTSHLPPTVNLQYFPMDPASAVQPYVGAGVNYTHFWGEENNLGLVVGLEDSFGLSVEAGIDVKVADNIVVNASVWKVDINTNVSINGTPVGELEIDPLVAMLAIGYTF